MVFLYSTVLLKNEYIILSLSLEVIGETRLSL